MVTTTRTDLFLPLLFLYACTADSGSTILDDQVGRAFVAANCKASFYKEAFYVRGARICLNGSSFFYVRGAHICLNGNIWSLNTYLFLLISWYWKLQVTIIVSQ